MIEKSFAFGNIQKQVTMKIQILKQVLGDAWHAVKLGYLSSRRDGYAYIHPTAIVGQPTWATKSNIYLYKNAKIGENSQINARKGKFIMKENARSGMFLTVIAQNHDYKRIGGYPGDSHWGEEEAADVIVEEDVWMGTNVTLCPGVHLGRGCVVAAGAVCIKSKEYPPYSIIGGNPAKFLKFKFTLEEQIEHEKIRFKEEDRLPEDLLRANYERFSIKKK